MAVATAAVARSSSNDVTSASMSIRHLMQCVIDTLLPPLCHVCREHLPDPSPLHICPACCAALPPLMHPLCTVCGIPFSAQGADHICGKCLTHPPAFDRARSVTAYEGPARSLIHDFKYHHKTYLCKPLGLLLADLAQPLAATLDSPVIVPVPLHSSKLQQRGFNQSVMLASTLSGLLKIQQQQRTLIRIRNTSPQADLSADARAENVRKAFSVTDPNRVKGMNIFLVDDVLTTGSTLHECARALKQAGAATVTALTVARALTR